MIASFALNRLNGAVWAFLRTYGVQGEFLLLGLLQVVGSASFGTWRMCIGVVITELMCLAALHCSFQVGSSCTNLRCCFDTLPARRTFSQRGVGSHLKETEIFLVDLCSQKLLHFISICDACAAVAPVQWAPEVSDPVFLNSTCEVTRCALQANSMALLRTTLLKDKLVSYIRALVANLALELFTASIRI